MYVLHDVIHYLTYEDRPVGQTDDYYAACRLAQERAQTVMHNPADGVAILHDGIVLAVYYHDGIISN